MDVFKMAKEDVPTHECQVCHIMHYRHEIKLIAESRKSPQKKKSNKIQKSPKKTKLKKFSVEELMSDETSVLRQLMANDNLILPLNVCKTQSIYSCHQAIMKNELPKLSSLNKMNVNPVPPELSCLNEFEKDLIQRAKCFITLMKLKPFRYRGPSNSLVKAKQGSATHFYLPPEKTVDYVAGYFTDPNNQQTLPSSEFVGIRVDSLPTKKKVIWQSLVDMKKVVAALEHLKNSGNPLYKNIKIDCSAFVTDDTEELDEENEEELVKFGPLLKHLNPEDIENNCEHYTMQALGQECAKSDDIDQFMERFQFKRAEGDPIKEYLEKNLEPLCFPCLIPDGVGHLKDTRKFPLKFQQYVVSRLKNADSRFRKDLMYLFYLLHQKEVKMIDQGICATFRSGIAPNMTSGQLMTQLQKKDKLLEANLNNLMRNFRGSDKYWNSKAMDLRAMDEKIGPATFFLTLSSKEYEWAELRNYLEELDPELKSKGIDLGYLCSINPVAVSIFFEHRFRRFMNGVILDKNGPLGEVIHYVWRLEYQSRGSPHVHMKLWIKDAPIIGKNTKEEVVAFIDKYITCRLPDPVKEPELSILVKANQMHKCTESCLKGVPGVKGVQKCRHGFPRSVYAETTLNTIEESVKSRVKGKKIKKIYNLARTEKEIHLNDHNVAILLMWQANIDLQYLGEESMILNYYITNYIAKSDRSATADLWDTISYQFSERTVTSNLKSLAFQSIKERQVGANEATDQILGHPLMKMSQTVINLQAKQKNERKRKFLSSDQLKASEENSTHLYCDNLIDVYYPNRPKELKHLCLYEVASKFSWRKGKMKPKFNPKTKEQTVFPFQIPGNNGLTCEDAYFQKRKECVVKTHVFNIGGDQTEKYFHQVLLLFKPFRDEETDLKNEDETYQEAFKSWHETLDEKELAKLNQYRACRERTRKAIEADVILREEAEAETTVEVENVDEDEDDEQEQNQDTAEFLTTVVDACTIEEKIKMLNSDQKRVFDKIVSVIQHQDRHEKHECDCGENIEALKMFVTGVGGTGKSFLIETLRDYIVRDAAEKKGDLLDHGYVVVLAPTGVAAYNVNGQTIHRCFKLPVQKGKTANPQCFSLNQTFVKEIRSLLKFAILIIIDEMSMVSNANFTIVHRRLDEVFGGASEGKSFGNKNILILGDLLQLKPVKAPYCFKPLTDKQLESVGGISLGYNLWDEFEYDLLTKIERQKEGESGFAELLSRLRVGSLTADDIDKLKGRLIEIVGYSRNARIKSAVKYFHENLKGKNALCVMSTNEQVKQFNDQMIEYCNIQTIDIECEEPFIKSADGKKRKRRKTLTKRKVSETAGLETVLTIGVGMRVMLRRNIDVSKGLVNGAMGNITKINFVRKNKVSSIEVLFDGQSKSTSIECVAGEYEKISGIFVTRKQFPLHVAYAITIHKCQGLSIDHIMVDLGNTIFENGQAYVALSRCRSLDGLHIIELKTNKLLCDIEAWDEYQRLHALNGLPAMPKPNTLDTKGSSSSIKRRPAKRSAETDIGSQPKRKQTTGVKRKREMENTSGSPVAKHGRIERTDVPSSGQVKFLKFQNNRENHCFINSAIQALLALDLQWNESRQYNDVCKKMAEYNDQMAPSSGSDKIINCGAFFRHNVAPLSTSAPFNDGNQNDAHEFTMALFEYLLPQMRHLFRHEEVIITTCQLCKRQSEERKSEESLILHRNAEYKTFADLITAKENIYDCICDNVQCRNYNKKTICERRRTLSFPPEFKYLIISMPIFSDTQGTRSKMKLDFKHSTVSFGDIDHSKWKTVTAIRFMGKSQHCGHYDCVRLVDNQLYVIGDTASREAKKFLDLKNIFMLILERI